MMHERSLAERQTGDLSLKSRSIGGASRVLAAGFAMVVACSGTPGEAGSASAGSSGDKVASVKPLTEMRVTGPLAAQYCAAVKDMVAEARFAQQAKELERLARQADDRLALLEKRSAELKEWIKKRDEFIASATKQLVDIFGAMRPESASEQLVRLDAATAAAILSKLDVRSASAILNDMPADKAARLAAVIAGSARKNSQEKP